MILMIDNYDSFTYNVYQYIGSLYPQIQVVRNDEITIDEIRNLQNLEALVISPGLDIQTVQGFQKRQLKHSERNPSLGNLSGTSGDRRSIWRKSRSSKRIDAWKNE